MSHPSLVIFIFFRDIMRLHWVSMEGFGVSLFLFTTYVTPFPRWWRPPTHGAVPDIPLPKAERGRRATLAPSYGMLLKHPDQFSVSTLLSVGAVLFSEAFSYQSAFLKLAASLLPWLLETPGRLGYPRGPGTSSALRCQYSPGWNYPSFTIGLLSSD